MRSVVCSGMYDTDKKSARCHMCRSWYHYDCLDKSYQGEITNIEKGNYWSCMKCADHVVISRVTAVSEKNIWKLSSTTVCCHPYWNDRYYYRGTSGNETATSPGSEFHYQSGTENDEYTDDCHHEKMQWIHSKIKNKQDLVSQKTRWKINCKI